MQFEHKISIKINRSVCFAIIRMQSDLPFEVLDLYLLDGSYTLPILHSRLGVNPHYPSCRHFYPIWRQFESGASLAGSSKANTNTFRKYGHSIVLVWSVAITCRRAIIIFLQLESSRRHQTQHCTFHPRT